MTPVVYPRKHIESVEKFWDDGELTRSPRGGLDEGDHPTSNQLPQELKEARRSHAQAPDALNRLSSTGIMISDALETQPLTFHPMPAQWGNRVLRAVRWHVASCYRRLFCLVLLANATSMLAFIVTRLRGGLIIAGVDDAYAIVASLQTAVAANLFTAVVLRNEHFINLLYRVFVVNITLRAPLSIRKAFAKIYCSGGIHSGCAVAACVWHLLCTAVEVFNLKTTGYRLLLTAVASLLVWMILSTIVVTSMPCMRAKNHNLFEVTHRFGGWAVVCLFWVQLVTGAANKDSSARTDAVSSTISSPAFWFLLSATILILYPWVRIRRISVRTQKLSNHAIRVYFDGYIQPCRTIRLSDRPLLETHAFAVIGACGGTKESSVIISRAGDWTSRVIENPPSRFWAKGHHCWGTLRVATLFKKVVVVATGSGIGPCISLFIGHPELPVRVLWSTKSPYLTYGREIIDAVRNADSEARIIDTTTYGRFDMVQLSYDLYVEAGAEAVVVISNPALTKEVVFGLESRGIAAFGPIWDS